MGVLDEVVTQLIDQRVEQLLGDVIARDGQLLVSTSEAGRRMGVSRDTVVALCEAGELTYVEGIGRGRLVTVESMRDYVSRHAVQHPRRRQIGRAS
jgi:excisionase family DNA binding protein